MRGILELVRQFASKVSHARRNIGMGFFFAALIFGGAFLFAEPAQATEWGKWVAGALTYILLLLTQLMGKIFLLFSTLLINVMQYNDFIDSPVVKAGWTVVRDVSNMFYIVALLMIAFGTILGGSYTRFGEIQMIPKLLGVSIAVNLSRTLIGFLIDISQVVMLTFVNAFKGAAAGNFAMMFSIGGSVNLDLEGLGGFDQIGGMLVAVVFGFGLLTLATVIVGLLCVVMLMRMAKLWVLIVIAPLAWTMLIVPTQQGQYGSWWKEFKGELLMGPIMAFFLWLTLATAAATANKFDASGNPVNLTIAATESASYANIVRAVISMALLLEGLKIATSQGGMGSDLLKKSTGYAGKIVGLGAAAQFAMTKMGLGSLRRGASGAAGWLGKKGVPGARAVSSALSVPLAARSKKFAAMQNLAGGALQKLGGAIPGAGGVLLGGALSAAGASMKDYGLSTKNVFGKGGILSDAMDKARNASALSGVPDVTKGGDPALAKAMLANLQQKALALPPGKTLSTGDLKAMKMLRDNTKEEDIEKMQGQGLNDLIDADDVMNAQLKADPEAFGLTKKDVEGREKKTKEHFLKSAHRMQNTADQFDPVTGAVTKKGLLTRIKDLKASDQSKLDADLFKDDASLGRTAVDVASYVGALDNDVVGKAMQDSDNKMGDAAFQHIDPSRLSKIQKKHKLQASAFTKDRVKNGDPEVVAKLFSGLGSKQAKAVLDNPDVLSDLQGKLSAYNSAQNAASGRDVTSGANRLSSEQVQVNVALEIAKAESGGTPDFTAALGVNVDSSGNTVYAGGGEENMKKLQAIPELYGKYMKHALQNNQFKGAVEDTFYKHGKVESIVSIAEDRALDPASVSDAVVAELRTVLENMKDPAKTGSPQRAASLERQIERSSAIQSHLA